MNERTNTNAEFLDCSDCVGNEGPECDDCIVRFVVWRDLAGCSEVGSEERQAIRALAEAGMLAEVRPLRVAG